MLYLDICRRLMQPTQPRSWDIGKKNTSVLWANMNIMFTSRVLFIFFLKETFSKITHRWNDCCSKKIINENSPVSFPFSHFLLFSFISFVIFSFIRGDKHTFILCRRVVETPILTTTTTTLLFAVTGYNAYRRHRQFHKWEEIMMYVIMMHSVKTRGVLKLDVLKGLVL